MKYCLKSLALFPLLLVASFAYSQEFKHLKLKAPLKRWAQHLQSQEQVPKTLSIKRARIDRSKKDPLERTERILKDALFEKSTKRSLKQGSLKSMAMPEQEGFSSGPGNNGMLFEEILSRIGPVYQDKGEEQVDSILSYNHKFNLGQSNFSGFNWQKPMGSFSVYANRQVTPNLMGMNWIVQDEMVIHVNASSFLNKLKENELIDITKEQLRAFAGVHFTRRYEVYHFANSFEEGLGSDFSSLFLPFLKFGRNQVLDLKPGQIMKMRDTLGAQAGAYAKTPSFYGLSAQFGALFEYEKMSELTLQAVSEYGNAKADEYLRLSLKDQKQTTAAVSAGVGLDFFNILKLTFFSYHLEYEYSSSKEYHLSFNQQDRARLKKKGDDAKNFSKLLRLNSRSIDHFRENFVEIEERMAENLSSEFNFLILGSNRSNKTEQYRIYRDQKSEVFYKTNEGRLRYIQSPLSKLFGGLIQGLFQIDTLVANQVENYEHYSIEYHSKSGKHDLETKSEEDFSLEINEYLMANKTTGSLNKKYKQAALDQLVLLTEIPNDIINKVKNDVLRGPLKVSTSLRVLKNGIHFFNTIDDNSFYYLLSYSCGSRRIHDWASASSRKDLLRGYKKVKKRFLWWTWKVKKRFKKTAEYKCTKNIGKIRDSYISKLRDHKVYDLNKFKKFVKKLYQKTRSYDYLRAFFGLENSFVHGSLEATGPEGVPFKTYYQTGNFEGLGVVDNFLNQRGVAREPASH